MPFVTEELWDALGERPYPLILAKWPIADGRALDPGSAAEIGLLIETVQAIRSARTELGVPPGAKLAAFVVGATPGDFVIARQEAALRRLARFEALAFEPPPSGASLQVPIGEATLVLPLAGVIDVAAEQARLARMAEVAEKERDALAARLANPAFVERANPQAVDKARADHEEKAASAERYRSALARLG
jgi:valyl-tRNA synthetase